MPDTTPSDPAAARRRRGRALVIAALFACALVAICLPRFNRRAVLGASAPGNLADARHYVDQVQYLRHQADGRALRAPFAYRPLGPLLAALLPFDPLTSLDLVNIAALLCTLAFLDRLLAALGCDGRRRALGAALFVFSFPPFYYGAIGYVDPVGLACQAAGLLFLVRRRWFALAVTLAVGAAAKETTIVLLPAAAAYLYRERSLRHRALLLAALCASYLVVALWVRHAVAVPPAAPWHASLETLRMNLSRPRAWLTFVLSFGFPGLLATLASIALLRRRSAVAGETAALLVGCVTVLAVFLFSLTAAYADGRFLWLAYPFAIPLAVQPAMKNGESGVPPPSP